MLARKSPPGSPPQKLLRFARVLVLVILFFAGAALSAVGGNAVVGSASTEPPPVEQPPAEPPPPPAEPAEPPPADPEPPADSPPADSTEASIAEAEEVPQAPDPQDSPKEEAGLSPAKQEYGNEPDPKPKNEAEEQKPIGPRWPTYWVRRAVPSPVYTENLRPWFAKELQKAATSARVDWELLLAVLRVNGKTSKASAKADELRRLANKLARLGPRDDAAQVIARLSGDQLYQDQVMALARYHRVVGLRALTRGLETARKRLTARLLEDPRVDLRPEGRSDIAAGRIDVRVMAMIAFLADTYGQVSVTSLLSGHRLYARPGVISAHIYGRAVDIGSLGGVSILSDTRPGGTTERGVYNTLLAPGQIRPRQLISVLGLGGPSFPLSDHGDHLHIGW